MVILHMLIHRVVQKVFIFAITYTNVHQFWPYFHFCMSLPIMLSKNAIPLPCKTSNAKIHLQYKLHQYYNYNYNYNKNLYTATWWTGCSQFRTPPPVWLLAPDAPTIYRRCSGSYTGYRYASASTSRWPHSYTRERRLRSTTSRTCVVTRTYSTFGDRAFGAAGPGLWNSLPSHLKDADLSYSEFRRSLKTFLFG